MTSRYGLPALRSERLGSFPPPGNTHSLFALRMVVCQSQELLNNVKKEKGLPHDKDVEAEEITPEPG